MKHEFSETAPEIIKLAERSLESYKIDPALYTQYDVKRGLRDLNGNGVVAGLTNISTIKVLERNLSFSCFSEVCRLKANLLNSGKYSLNTVHSHRHSPVM